MAAISRCPPQYGLPLRQDVDRLADVKYRPALQWPTRHAHGAMRWQVELPYHTLAQTGIPFVDKYVKLVR